MKYCSSVVIGDIDAYLYHIGGEFSEAYDVVWYWLVVMVANTFSPHSARIPQYVGFKHEF